MTWKSGKHLCMTYEHTVVEIMLMRPNKVETLDVFHTSFVGVETWWLLIVFNDNSGLRVVFSWWSMIGDSMLSVHKMIPVNPCRSSFEADLVLWPVCSVDDDDDDGLILFSEWDWENSLGCEREGSVRGKGASKFRCWDGECFKCEGWGGMICAGRWGCCCFFRLWLDMWLRLGLIFLALFFLPSPCLCHHWPFSFSGLYSFPCPQAVLLLVVVFSFFFYDADVWITVVTAISIVTVVVSADVISFVGVDVIFATAIVTVVVMVAVDDLTGDFLFPLYGLPWSTPLLCWGGPQFPGFVLLLVLFSAFVTVAAVAVFIVVDFWRQDWAKWPSYLQDQHRASCPQQPPSLSDLCMLSYGGWPETLPYPDTWWKSSHRMPSHLLM